MATLDAILDARIEDRTTLGVDYEALVVECRIIDEPELHYTSGVARFEIDGRKRGRTRYARDPTGDDITLSTAISDSDATGFIAWQPGDKISIHIDPGGDPSQTVDVTNEVAEFFDTDEPPSDPWRNEVEKSLSDLDRRVSNLEG